MAKNYMSVPQFSISDFKKLGETDPFYADLAEIVAKTKGLWNVKAEEYLLKNAPEI